MNQSETKTNLVEGVVVVGIVFVILAFAIFKYGGADKVVTNPDLKDTEEYSKQLNDVLNSGSVEGSENELYNKYVKKIYEAQKSGTGSDSVDTILEEYKNELESKVYLPPQQARLKYVGTAFDQKTYLSQYETLYVDMQKKGGNSESRIFASQIVDNETLLPLSDYDKQTLERIAVEYENFALNVESLKTPKVYEQKSVATVENARSVSYLIRQLINTNDKQLYTLWINKYSTLMFDIIANRYAH